MPTILWCALLLAGQTQTPGPGSEVTQEVVARPVGRVTASYIRMHAAGAVLSMAQDVKAGKLDRRFLESVAGPKAAKALLAAKIGGGKPTVRAVKPGKGPIRPLGGKRADYSFGTFTDDDGGLIDLTADYAPTELAFPSLFEGERSDLLFLLHPTKNGAVTASLPADLNFKIVEIRLYDGLIKLELQQAGPRISLASRRTIPPWTMNAAAGQSVGLVVRFEPDFHIVKNGAGVKKSALEVSLAAPVRTITVPLKGRFRGISLGVIAFPDEPEITVIHPDSYYPKQPHVLEAPIEMINAKEATTGTIRPLTLPPGVSMSPLTVSIGEKASKVVKVPLQLDRSDTKSIWFTPYEVPHPIILEVQFGERRSQVGFYAVVYPSSLYWGFNEDVGGCDVAGHLIVYGSGRFVFYAQAYNNDLVVHRTVIFRGGFDGLDLINMVITAQEGESTTNSYGFHRQYYEDHYTGLVHKGLTLTIKVRYPWA